MFPSVQRLIPLEDRGPLAGHVRHHVHAGRRRGDAAGRVDPADGSLADVARAVLPEVPRPAGRSPGRRRFRRVPGLLAHKYDFAVLGRLTRLLRQRRIDAVVTVGTGGDKMFWGRLAAWLAGVPVICSSLHSTGLPDHVEWPNRLLAPITDAFIAVAEPHGRYLSRARGLSGAEGPRDPQRGRSSSGFIRVGPNAELRGAIGLPDGVAGGRHRGGVAAGEASRRVPRGGRAGARRGCRDAGFWSSATARERERLEALARQLRPGRARCISWARGTTCRRCCP